MRIRGLEKLKPRRASVQVGEDPKGNPVSVILQAPRLGAVDDVLEDLDDPVPPDSKTEVQRDSRQRVVKDAAGNRVMAKDFKDPGYVKAVDEFFQIKGVATIILCLNGEIELGSKREDFKTANEFYRAVFEEFAEVGIGHGEFNRLCRVAGDLVQGRDFQDKIDSAQEELAPGGPESQNDLEDSGSSA